MLFERWQKVSSLRSLMFFRDNSHRLRDVACRSRIAWNVVEVARIASLPCGCSAFSSTTTGLSFARLSFPRQRQSDCAFAPSEAASAVASKEGVRRCCARLEGSIDKEFFVHPGQFVQFEVGVKLRSSPIRP